MSNGKRLTILDGRVRALVDTCLAPLVAIEGSVNAAAERLNTLLREHKVEESIYPNRLHALLKEDPTRALNSGSVELISRAAELLSLEHSITTGTATAQLDELSRQMASDWATTPRDNDAIAALSQKKRLPPAVVRFLLNRTGEHPEVSPNHLPHLAKRARTPDWSFQDDATRIAVSRLSTSPIPRIGVVVPTGGGKTTIGLRVGLELLAKDVSLARRVAWVTHRVGLRRQSHRALQKLLNTNVHLPEDAFALANRIDFVMVSQLERYLAESATTPALIIVDEAHHAAASSYDPLFEGDSNLPILGLTATPRRSDLQPIRIDEIGYQITYRELAERGVIVKPEFKPFPVENFDWTPGALDELAIELLDGAEDQYVKTLVIAPRIDRVREFYDAIVAELARAKAHSGHALDVEDVGYITSESNSLGMSSEEFLDIFAAKPRGIIVSAQMLIEGFDDPAINTVVVTYPSSSLLLLMQAAGRCVRWHPGKTHSYVVQARNDELAYYFDQRWLYQEISDALRPALQDVTYNSGLDRTSKVEQDLAHYHVKDSEKASILENVRKTAMGSTCRLMLAGLPYDGNDTRFDSTAAWAAILETSTNSEQLRALFNGFSEEDPEVDPQAYLKRVSATLGIAKSLEAGSLWRSYSTLLASMVNARREISESAVQAVQVGRPYRRNGASTWLRYIAYSFDSIAPTELLDFLSDCYNKDAVVEMVSRQESAFTLVLKIPVPLGLYEAHPLTGDVENALLLLLEEIRQSLKDISIEERFATFSAQITAAKPLALPRRVLDRLEPLLILEEYEKRTFSLSTLQPISQ